MFRFPINKTANFPLTEDWDRLSLCKITPTIYPLIETIRESNKMIEKLLIKESNFTFRSNFPINKNFVPTEDWNGMDGGGKH